jgi:iron-sulfur cluster repair protein YtfE (RIC family)
MEDHKKVLGLFEEFERIEEIEAKKAIADNASMELMTHLELEEELFYPELERHGEEAEEMIAEAEEEHHVVKIIISELADMKAGDSHYDAKVKVMAENCSTTSRRRSRRSSRWPRSWAGTS